MIRAGRRGPMRHLSMWPLLWQAACGATGVALFSDEDLVNCPGCLAVVAAVAEAAAS